MEKFSSTARGLIRSFGTGPMIFLEVRVKMWLIGLQNLAPSKWER
jgi:hypothetical protein